MRWTRIGLAWLGAVLAMVLAASLVHSLAVQARLVQLGVELPVGLRVESWLGDLAGMGPALLVVFGLALAVGLLVAGWLKPRVRALASIAEPLAGAAAVGLALYLMHLQYAMTPLASARGPVGFAAMCLAGALGGLVYARLRGFRA